MQRKPYFVIAASVLVAGLFSSVCQAREQWLLADLGFNQPVPQTLSGNRYQLQHDPYWTRHVGIVDSEGPAYSHSLTIEQTELTQPWDNTSSELVNTRSLWQSSLFDAGGAWHLTAARAEGENHLQFGRTQGRFSLLAMSGQGFGFSRLPHLYRNLSPYFFHGGTNTTFDFSGFVGDVELAPETSLQFAEVTLSHDQLEPRHARLLGFAHSRAAVQLTEVDRGGEQALRGLDLSLNLGPMQWTYKALKSKNRAELHQLGASWPLNHRTSVGLNIETRRNPLFSALDDQRLMFRISHLFGGEIELYAHDKREDGEAKKTRRTPTVGVIGISLVAAAAIGSSGSDTQDNAARLTQQDEAGRAVLNGINPTSVRQNREHGGWVYQNPDGSFSATTPVQGELASVNIGNPLTSVPPGTVATASYHTHGGSDPRFLNEQFSPQDLSADRFFGVDGYLGTPAGALLFHNFRNGPENVSRIGTIAN